jgi:hypothetical protein
MLRTLWRRKLLVVLGILIAVAAGVASAYNVRLGVPPKLGSKSIEFGSASAQLLIDSADASPIVDLEGDLDPLATRAQLYAQLVESAPVRDAIARRAGVPVEKLVITSAASSEGTRASKEPSAEQRANALRGEQQTQRVLFEADDDLPVIKIFTQAATDGEAIALADASATGLIDYLTSARADQRVPRTRQVEVRRLGDAQGGMVNEGASMSVAVLAFLAVFVGWCFLVLLVSGLIEGLRAAQVMDQLEFEPSEAEGGEFGRDDELFDLSDVRSASGRAS